MCSKLIKEVVKKIAMKIKWKLEQQVSKVISKQLARFPAKQGHCTITFLTAECFTKDNKSKDRGRNRVQPIFSL